jgi:dTDP-glucose 4,6-dehydratase
MIVLITGVSGFIGSHVLSHILKETDWEVVGIASWQHKGTPERILEDDNYQTHKDRVKIITHDLTAPFTAQTKQRIGHIDYIINIASDSHVDRSITDPVPFIQNNVNLVLNMLELARELKPKMFIQFSTDEVYGSAPDGVNHKEWSTILPSNPYSASKASQEAIVVSYWRTYNVPVIITNTMNVFGERQDKEKFLAMCISKINKSETVTIHGKKGFIGSRYYIHARNVASALLHIIKNVKPVFYTDEGSIDRPERFNIVGDKEIDNYSMARLIASLMGKELYYKFEDFHATRPGHDRRYALDGAKLKETGFSYPMLLEKSLDRYIKWTLKNDLWL